MAPKKVKITQPPAEAPEAKEERPLTFEDLPKNVLGVILRRLEDGKDRLRLTQASPSVRRLSSGPNAEPGVLGQLELSFIQRQDLEPIKLRFGSEPTFDAWLNTPRPDFEENFAPFLSWLKSKAKAFARVAFSFGWGNTKPPIPQTLVSILKALFEVGYRGVLDFQFTTLGADTDLLPVFELLCSSRPPNPLLLSSQFSIELEPISKLLTSLASFKEVKLVQATGKWSPEFFSLSKDLEIFTIQDLSKITDFSLPTACTSLKRLELDPRASYIDSRHGYNYETEEEFPTATFDVPPLFASLDPAFLRPLRVLKLGQFREAQLPLLSVLEALPDLVTLNIVLYRDLGKPTPVPPDFSLTLPRLKYLVLTLNLYVDLAFSRASLPDSFGVAFPLGWLSCPEARLLKVNVTNDLSKSNENFEGKGISLAVGSLASFPSLRCLCLEAEDHFLYNINCSLLRFKVRTDFRETPDLAFFSCVAQGCSLPPPPYLFSLPVTKSVATVTRLGTEQNCQATILECGDRGVLEELEKSPDFPWREKDDSAQYFLEEWQDNDYGFEEIYDQIVAEEGGDEGED